MRTIYHILLAAVGIGFALFFFITIGPLIIEDPSRIDEAIMAGFVNPFSTGYSIDAITCWVVLALWVIHEKMEKGIKHGWIALLLGLIPGVVTGFALYLILRDRQESAI